MCRTHKPLRRPPVNTFTVFSTLAPRNQDTGDDSESANTCAGEGSFTITAKAAPELNGCFADSVISGADEKMFYTLSGTMNTTDIFVTAVENDTGDVSYEATGSVQCVTRPWLLCFDP